MAGGCEGGGGGEKERQGKRERTGAGAASGQTVSRAGSAGPLVRVRELVRAKDCSVVCFGPKGSVICCRSRR